MKRTVWTFVGDNFWSIEQSVVDEVVKGDAAVVLWSLYFFSVRAENRYQFSRLGVSDKPYLNDVRWVLPHCLVARMDNVYYALFKVYFQLLYDTSVKTNYIYQSKLHFQYSFSPWSTHHLPSANSLPMPRTGTASKWSLTMLDYIAVTSSWVTPRYCKLKVIPTYYVRTGTSCILCHSQRFQRVNEQICSFFPSQFGSVAVDNQWFFDVQSGIETLEPFTFDQLLMPFFLLGAGFGFALLAFAFEALKHMLCLKR